MLLFEEETLPLMMQLRLLGHILLEFDLINASITHHPRIVLTKPLDHLILIPSYIFSYIFIDFCFDFRFWELFGIEWFHLGVFQWGRYMILFASTIDKA